MDMGRQGGAWLDLGDLGLVGWSLELESEGPAGG